MRTWLCCALVLLLPTLGAAIPDLGNSTVEWAYEGEEILSLMVVPDGTGFAFDQARPPGNPVSGPVMPVDATITLTIIDGLDTPVANFPSEDIWLESADGGMIPCVGGTIADQDTDVLGRTYWRQPLLAGGSSMSTINVRVNGDRIGDRDLPLWINSPDLNGDGVVNLVDISTFAPDFHGAYTYASDFNNDGVINLADIPYLAAANGSHCP